MPHSLKSKVKSLCYKGELSEKERDRIIQALEQTELNPSYNGVKSELKPSEDWKFYYNHGYAQAKRDLLCEDCISRAEVRRILGNEVFELTKIHTVNPKDNPKADAMAYGVNWSLNTLMELPSVTPSYNGVKSELKPCEDCISRAEVIKIFGEVHPLDYNKQSYIANIKKLPSVTPKAESEEQYKADLQGAYDCGYNCGYTDAMSDIYERGENE